MGDLSMPHRKGSAIGQWSGLSVIYPFFCMEGARKLIPMTCRHTITWVKGSQEQCAEFVFGLNIIYRAIIIDKEIN